MAPRSLSVRLSLRTNRVVGTLIAAHLHPARMPPSLALIAAASAAAPFAPPYAVLRYRDFAPLIRDTLARPAVRNYSAWAENNVPLLDFPDADIQTAYYYRWRLFREHVESTTVPSLALIDEFLPEPGGRGPISCAGGHHFADGLWLRDASVLDDQSEYWFERAGDALYDYTHWIGSSALRRQTLRGDRASGATLLQRLLRAWRGGSAGKTSYTGYASKYLDEASGCWWQVDDRDGMEFGISGNGCRPTINAVLYGEAQAIVELATWLGNASVVTSPSFLDSTATILLKSSRCSAGGGV